LVVPSAFVAALRAEQTSAILLFFICDLDVNGQWGWGPNPTTSSAIFSANFPTLVPPNFCTIQPLSTFELRCRLTPFTTGTPFGGSPGIVAKRREYGNGDSRNNLYEFLGTGGGPEEFYRCRSRLRKISSQYERQSPSREKHLRSGHNIEVSSICSLGLVYPRWHRLLISSGTPRSYILINTSRHLFFRWERIFRNDHGCRSHPRGCPPRRLHQYQRFLPFPCKNSRVRHVSYSDGI